MPWCPKCKIEYVEGIKMCSDCHIELTDELPSDDYNEKYDRIEMTLIVTVADEIEAGRIEALFATNNIPVMRKYDGPGGSVKIITGNTSFGIGIYVPEPFARKAFAVLSYEDGAEEGEVIVEDDDNDSGDAGIDDANAVDTADDIADALEEESDDASVSRGGFIKPLVITLLIIAAVIAVIYTRGAW